MPIKKELYEIAERNVYGLNGRGDLEQRFSDEEDFLDISVWGLRTMLEEAYQLGKQEGARDKNRMLSFQQMSPKKDVSQQYKYRK